MDVETYPPFIFDIFDEDDGLFDSTPDFLCRAIVEPENCIKSFRKAGNSEDAIVHEDRENNSLIMRGAVFTCEEHN